MKLKFKNRDGNLMVEAIVGISISIIGLLGIVAMLSKSLAISKDVSQKFVATYLAAEGIEVIKSLIDKNYVDGQPWNKDIRDGEWEVVYGGSSLQRATGRFLYFDPQTGIYNYDTTKIQTPFQRIASTTAIGSDEIKVVSVVSWTERGVPKSVKLEDHFFNWRITP
jgi:hypothetical protein